MAASEPVGPLAGLRVIDASTILAGPMACQVLGDYGADVIKVEHPANPDGMRGHGPAVDGEGLWWKSVARNKRTVAINLSNPAGSSLLLELVKTADVLVENFRPGTLERWGLGWEQLHAVNPKLVLLRVTGFGQTGPYAERRAFGTLAEAMSGFAHLTGSPDRPPSLPPFGLADSITAHVAVGAVMMALYHRDIAEGGEGQVIDLSILESMIGAVGPGPMAYDRLGTVDTRQGNRSLNNSPRNLYRTKDGHWVAVSASALNVATRVMTLVGHPEVVDEPWFQTGRGRVEHVDEIDSMVANWIAERTREDVVAAFDEAGAAIAPVYDAADIVADPQVQHRQILTRVADGDESILMQNVTARLSSTPGQIRFAGRSHAADTDEVLRDLLDLDSERIDSLRRDGVIA